MSTPPAMTGPSRERSAPEDEARTITPVVLVGGRSRRFGRDKLLEPLAHGGRALVEAPVAALREAFGSPVRLVGSCAPLVERLAPDPIPDAPLGAGPIAGILGALRACPGPIFVLAGDMPGITARDVRRVLAGAARRPDADAIVASARDGRPNPCVALYRRSSYPILREAALRGEHALHGALARANVATVSLPDEALANVNTPEDARGVLSGAPVPTDRP